MKFYTGVGSRKTPQELAPIIRGIARYLAKQGYILRSGGASGADTFFEETLLAQEKRVFLPWRGFNGNKSPYYNPTPAAISMAMEYHPNWGALNMPGRQLMARNSHQVMGLDLKTPSEFIICWTPKGAKTGGTAQAIRIAEANSIPVLNLFGKNTTAIKEWLKSNT